MQMVIKRHIVFIHKLKKKGGGTLKKVIGGLVSILFVLALAAVAANAGGIGHGPDWHYRLFIPDHRPIAEKTFPEGTIIS